MTSPEQFHKRLLAYGRMRKLSDAEDFASWGIIRYLETNERARNPEWLYIDYLRVSRGNVRTEGGRLQATVCSLDAPVKEDSDTTLHELVGKPDPEPEDTEVRELALSKLPAPARPLAELYLDGLQHTRLRLIAPWRLWQHCTPKRIKLAVAKAKVELALKEAGELPPIDMRLEIDWIEL